MKVLVALCLLLVVAGSVKGEGKAPRAALDEDFGYVEVRTGAHMFWVTYHVDQPEDWTTYPLIMWLQGGPGASGVGYGNFEELGPYYTNGTLRETAWTKKANVMFVDNPVGTGYSYVEDLNLLTTTNQEIADDLVTLLTSVFTDHPEMSTMPFFVYAESYGGKMTVDFALALDQAIKSGSIVCNFQGVALGDSWISPMDSVNTWGPFLYAMGFVNAQGEARINDAAAATQAAVDAGDWVEATNLWGSTENSVLIQTNGVNFYNVLAKEDIYFAKKSPPHSRDLSYMSPEVRGLYQTHVGGISTLDALDDLMNGPQADRWGIPSSVVWDSQGGYVFNTLAEDFMKPVVDSVVALLETTDVFVTVFSGDLDLICDTPGTYRWIENMEWSGKASFDAKRRQNIHVTEYSSQAGYIQQDGNFAVFTILRSGHMVPIDAPEAALVMVDMITGFGAGRKTAANAKKVQAKVHKALRKDAPPMKDTKVEEAPKVVAEPAPQAAKPASKPAVVSNPDVVKPVVSKAPVSAEQKAAHEPIAAVHHSHVTPSGEGQGKRDIISKKLRKKSTAPSGLNVAPPVVPVKH